MQIQISNRSAFPLNASAPSGPGEPMGDVVWAMDVFAELVQPWGPLCALRFDASAFSACLSDLPTPLTEEALDRAFAKHIGSLGHPSFLRRLHTTLSNFCRTTYADEAHRLAARVAMTLTPQDCLAPQQQGRDAPGLYPIFRAQACETLNIAMSSPQDSIGLRG